MQDVLNQGERSDRAFIAWQLPREPGQRQVAGDPDALVRDADGEPEVEDRAIVSPASVAIPREYAELRTADPACADRWREAIAHAFERCLSAGLFGLGFDRDRSAYVFGTPTEDGP
jgi:predicted GNAT superfamily acetyltransferase